MFENKKNDKSNKRSTARVRASDIPASSLNARCRNIISKYALLAFNHDQTKFDLRGESVLREVIIHARATHDWELKALYSELKSELRIAISSPTFKAQPGKAQPGESPLDGNGQLPKGKPHRH